MSDARYFTRLKAQDVEAEISVLESRRGSKQKKAIMKRIIANITMGSTDTAILLPHVLRFYEYGDSETKALCCLFFCSYSFYKPSTYYKSRSIFEHDLAGSDASIRALAIRTLACIPDLQLQEKVIIPWTKKLLDDDIKAVRKTACFVVGKLYELAPELTDRYGLIEKLNTKLSDSSSEVVAATLAVLDYIIEHSDSMKLSIDWSNVETLLQILPTTGEFFQTYILNAMLSYAPKTESEAVKLIESILPYLAHYNTGVALNAIKVIVLFCNYVKAPQDRIAGLPKRLGNSLVSLLAKSPEIQFLVLRNVILILLAQPQLLKLDVSMFFCQHNDPIYIKDTKLEIIYLLANASNYIPVVRELEQYSRLSDTTMVRKAIRAMGNLAIKLSDASELCVECLTSFASSGLDVMMQETVAVMKNVYRRYPDLISAEVLQLYADNIDILQDSEAKIAFLWLIGAHSDLVPNANIIFKDFVFTILDEPVEVQLVLLTSVVKYYIKNKSKSEQLLLSALNTVTQKCLNPDVRERAFYYWRIVSSHISDAASDVVLAELPMITPDQDNLPPEVLEELELCIGTLVSVYLKPIKSVFRLSKSRKLTDSPALQKEYNSSIAALNDTKDQIATRIPVKVIKVNLISHVAVIKSPRLDSEAQNVFKVQNEPNYKSPEFIEQAKFLAKSPIRKSHRDSFVKNHILSQQKSVLFRENEALAGSSSSGSGHGKMSGSFSSNSSGGSGGIGVGLGIGRANHEVRAGPLDHSLQAHSPKLGAKIRSRVRNSIIVSPNARNFTF